MVGVGDILALRREYAEWRRQQRAGPEQRLTHQQAIKGEMTGKLRPASGGRAQRVIIRDLARLDAYPTLDDRPRGISAWFKVEAKGLYHRGLEVIVDLRDVVVDGSVARDKGERNEQAEALRVYVVGRIPYDAIVAVDWEGDEYYDIPHIFCWFQQAEGPYEETVLYLSGDDEYPTMLQGITYRPERRSRYQQWRTHRELLKAQRAFEREVWSQIDA